MDVEIAPPAPDPNSVTCLATLLVKMLPVTIKVSSSNPSVNMAPPESAVFPLKMLLTIFALPLLRIAPPTFTSAVLLLKTQLLMVVVPIILKTAPPLDSATLPVKIQLFKMEFPLSLVKIAPPQSA